jgi:hypothetical protein
LAVDVNPNEQQRRFLMQPGRFVPRTPQHFQMIFYHEEFPKPPEMHRYLCGCGYTVFKASAINIKVSNDIGMPWREYEPGSHLIAVTCKNCNSEYTILFQ